ncbi:hypothetical protein RF55_9811, partial [Lasius niger]
MTTIQGLTVLDLKEILRAHGQPTSGSKAELICRMTAADPAGAWLQESNGVRGDRSEAELTRSDEDVQESSTSVEQRGQGPLPVIEEG